MCDDFFSFSRLGHTKGSRLEKPAGDVTFEAAVTKPEPVSAAAVTTPVRLWPALSSTDHAGARSGAQDDPERLQQLMEGYQNADRDAAAELVSRLSPMLLRFLSGPLQTRSHAEDMLQECWLRIHRARHSFRPGSPVLPWIFAIARHTRVDAYRRRSQIDQRETFTENLESVSRAAEWRPEEDGEELWRLVRQLPPSQQEVVRMLKVGGLSLEETARATGATVGAVKQKAHRAYRKLRELIEAERTAKEGEQR